MNKWSGFQECSHLLSGLYHEEEEEEEKEVIEVIEVVEVIEEGIFCYLD